MKPAGGVGLRAARGRQRVVHHGIAQELPGRAGQLAGNACGQEAVTDRMQRQGRRLGCGAKRVEGLAGDQAGIVGQVEVGLVDGDPLEAEHRAHPATGRGRATRRGSVSSIAARIAGPTERSSTARQRPSTGSPATMAPSRLRTMASDGLTERPP